MAYDRYDRDERDHGWWSNRSEHDHRHDRDRERSHRGSADRGGRDERGWFERAGDEISSWFGGNDRDERGSRDHDHSRDRGIWRSSGNERPSRDYDRGYGRDNDRDRTSMDRGLFSSGGSSARDYNPSWRRELGGRDRDRSHSDRDYRPMAGDYGRGAEQGRSDYRDDHRQYGRQQDQRHQDHHQHRSNDLHADSEQLFAASGIPRRGYGHDDDRRSGSEREQSPWGRDEYRRTSYAGSRERGASRDPGRGGNMDPHYDSWRDRHMSEMDHDYDEYRRERQGRFESDFAGWREKRGQKRAMMSSAREHMEVVGKDGGHVGTVDKVAGDRLILTKSDPQSGGRHHSISCSDVDRIEGDRIILDCSADQARDRWRDEERGRALFEREERGQDGPHILNRSFEGTYRR